VDFAGLVTLLGLPLALASLSFEQGHLPPPWEYSGESSSPLAGILFLPTFAAIWSALGAALHPAVTTPGQLLAGISTNVRSDVPGGDLALRGVFAYFGLCIPIFRVFGSGLEASSTLRKVGESESE